MRFFVKYLMFFIPVMTSLTLFSCQKSNEDDKNDPYVITIDPTNLTFVQEGEEKSFTIETDAPEWTISVDEDWVTVEPLSGETGTTTIQVKADAFDGAGYRRTSLSVEVEGLDPTSVTIRQNGGIYPNYNTSPQDPNSDGMESSAEELAAEMSIGWNIGNTMEAIGGETAWGNPEVSKELIDLVKASGFNAIRIPCAWNQYMSNEEMAELDVEWLDRVKEVVQYCIDNEMYVLLNIHWDGGWLENNCVPEKQDENNAKQKAFWEQIATHLRDYDEHLIFASANEPNVDDEVQMEVLLSYHQTFVDAVRSTGGRNSYRVLVVQGPSTDIEKTNNLMNSMPSDEAEDRMMAEVHFYTPWNFCGLENDESWGKMFYYWGEGYHSETDTERNANWGEEDDIMTLFNLMENKFVKKGIPVLMGEYGAIRRSGLTGDALQLHLDSRAYYLEFVTSEMKKRGIIPFYWDNGGLGNNAFGIFDRKTNTVFDQQTLDALISGAAE